MECAVAKIPGFRQRIIPEPHVPSRGSQARGTRLAWQWTAPVMAYKGIETDVLYGVEMAWRADATAHALLPRGFTF